MNQLWLWVGFNAFVVAMLALDLGLFHRKSKEIKVREALMWTGVWMSLALIFAFGVYTFRGEEKSMEFLAGYLIEQLLSVDNIFVFILIFSFFQVPPKYQHRVLFWGIIGALTMRVIFIFAGVALIQNFHWIIYLFGALLIYTGVKMVIREESPKDPQQSWFMRTLRRFIPVTNEFHGEKFFIKQNGKRYATPLFMVLLMIEASDLVFAVDSIPAILAVSQDPFIVYTSNVFAIMGLRSLYFALSGIAQYFHYLKYGLSAVLVFVGFKMVMADFYKVPIEISLLIIVSILAISILASILYPPKQVEQATEVS